MFFLVVHTFHTPFEVHVEMWYGATTADIAGRKSDLVHELKLRHHLQIPNADTQLHSTVPLLPLSLVFID
jgi:hypothetical protein